MLCLFKKHRYRHIANFKDIPNGRGLYQCDHCKKLVMSMPEEYYLRRFHDKKPNILEDGIHVF